MKKEINKFIKNSLLLIVIIFCFDCSIMAQNDTIIIGNLSSNFYVVSLGDTLVTTPSVSYAPYSLQKNYNIDIDNNGIVDFYFLVYSYLSYSGGSNTKKITMSSGDSSYFFVNPSVMDVISPSGATITVYVPMVNKLELNDTLFSNSLFLQSSTPIAESRYNPNNYLIQYSSLDNWIGGIHYIGIKKRIQGADYFGWIKVEVTAYNSIKMKELVLNRQVFTVEDNEFEKYNVFPNPACDLLNIKCSEVNPNKIIKVFNINGEEFLVKVNKTFDTIDISELSNGFYYIKIIENNKCYIVKFIKI